MEKPEALDSVWMRLSLRPWLGAAATGADPESSTAAMEIKMTALCEKREKEEPYVKDRLKLQEEKKVKLFFMRQVFNRKFYKLT